MEAGGWVEEVFYSLFRIGFCYEQLANRAANKQHEVTEADEMENAKTQEEQYSALAFLFSKAWEYRPTRLSRYINLRMYRLKSQNNIALMYALQRKFFSKR